MNFRGGEVQNLKEAPVLAGELHLLCRANMGRIRRRQSSPDSGPSFQVEVFRPFQVDTSSLGCGKHLKEAQVLGGKLHFLGTPQYPYGITYRGAYEFSRG